jgi:hypothetical protein
VAHAETTSAETTTATAATALTVRILR